MSIRLRSEYPDISALHASILDILGANELCTLAVIGPGGLPHAATAYFCYTPELRLYCVSSRSSVHGRALTEPASVALTVYDSRQPWAGDHKGLQLFGNGSVLTRTKSARALSVHAARFKAYGDYVRALSPRQVFSSPFRFFCIEVTQLKVFDETRFGEETFVTVDVERHG